MQEFETPPTSFMDPQKVILNQRVSMDRFRHMCVFHVISRFISNTNDIIQGLLFDAAPAPSPAMQKLIDILDKTKAILADTPPVTRDVRYGNPSFRTFIDKLRAACTAWHKEILPPEYEDATREINVYFLEMFGSFERLDYGTGHELNFICWVFCFIRLGLLATRDDVINIGLRLAPAYITIVQTIQNVLTLEPAGSHGAWSVDDFNLLPFVWGSSQLINRKLGVQDIFYQEKLKAHQGNLYVMMLENIYQVKTGDLRVTSPFISEVHMQSDTSWTKINNGMYKHYQTEVLCKWPIMQHFWFGKIIPFQ